MASDSGAPEIVKASAGSPVSTAASSSGGFLPTHIVDDDIAALKLERSELMAKKKVLRKDIKKTEMRRLRAKRKQSSLLDNDLLEELERRRRRRENEETSAANPEAQSSKKMKT